MDFEFIEVKVGRIEMDFDYRVSRYLTCCE